MKTSNDTPLTAITIYLHQIEQNLATGHAQEHTHRSALENLFETLVPHVNAVNEPKQIACGAPDLVVLETGSHIPLGYIEAKNIGISLDKTLKEEQLKRYLDSLNNLILTDYLEFRWFVEGKYQPEMTVKLAQVNKNGILTPFPAATSAFQRLTEVFTSTPVVTLTHPNELAQRMAKIARLIRNLILTAYRQEPTGNGTLHAQLEGFRQVLLDHLTVEQFADMYAQTICYGLFAARCHLPTQGKTFSRVHAAYYLPKTNPFLRGLFSQIAGVDLDERLVWAVEHLVTVLNRADIAAILADFGKRTRQEDPVVHFYETFLAQYDPNMRERRGVYYTPEPVVSYIVRSVDKLLKHRFGLQDGLADSSQINTDSGAVHKVQILDPAVGTGTFLYAAIEQIYQKFSRNRGLWSSYVRAHLLPRVHGFELLMAPYTVAHMKLGLQLQEKGYDFTSDERLHIFLTNTLDEAHTAVQQTWMTQWLATEANAATAIKTDVPVMVIIGNPPYSGHSANVSEWITKLLRGGDGEEKLANYFEVDGHSLGERNPKWLNDDYVKFIRFAHWRIMQTGYGILGFVTNHGYLDNPTFRGMRQSLLRDFDEIYVVDLHGNAKKKEMAPNGSLDKNVFDIQQGVAIGIFVKNNQKTTEYAQVYHAELWGERKGKYQWLVEQDVSNMNWVKLKPQKPFYLFVEQNTKSLPEYEKYWKITDIMPTFSTGVKTHRDHFVLSFDEKTLHKRIGDFRNLDLLDKEIADMYSLKDTRDWKINKRRLSLLECLDWKKYFTQCLYRPFDLRAYYHHKDVVELPREEVMRHMLAGKNLALSTTRSIEIGRGWEHVFCTHSIIQHHTVSLKEVNYLFPLYLYPIKTTDLFNLETPNNQRRPNFAPEFITDLENRLKLAFIPNGCGDFEKTIGPEDIFHYIYAIFHSPTYRQRYAAFLKIDFPRVPLTNDTNLFQQLAALGQKLVKIHLMEADELNSDSSFPMEGDNIISKVTYQNERVYINQTQYFDNVKLEIWQYHIGGYQVAEKWLKDRKGRTLNYDDCQHYLYILAALENTLTLTQNIDKTLPRFPLK